MEWPPAVRPHASAAQRTGLQGQLRDHLGQGIVRNRVWGLQPANGILPVRLERRQWRAPVVRPNQRVDAVAGEARSDAFVSAPDTEAAGTRGTRHPQLD